MKPIFVITLIMPMLREHQQDVREKLEGYHVIFLTGETEKCQLFSIKETIELADLATLQEYLDNHHQNNESHEDAVKRYLDHPKDETDKDRLDRINKFRCGY